MYDQNVPGMVDATFHIEKGEFVFLVGPSGSGKSTLIKLVLKQLEPTEGRILVAGRNLQTLRRSKVPLLRRNIGCVFQDFKLLPNKTVYENVGYALEVVGEHRRSIRRKVPEILNLVGLTKVKWLGNELTATPALGIMTIWGFGNFIVIYLAGLQGIPRTYLEAVEIDGGNAWHKFRHVTLPLLSPVILFNVLMSIVANLQVFVPALSITRGGPNSSTLYMVYYIFRQGFQNNRFGYASAVSLIFFAFIAVVTAVIYATSRKWMFFEGE